MQLAQTLAPCLLLNFPTGQRVQLGNPFALLYIPARHGVQEAGLLEKLPAVQSVQRVAPRDLLNFPAAQVMQPWRPAMWL
jgi:hypothetical protein